ncbi:MAG: pyridoxal phosphate-dependent class II aminotransferase [Desulfobacteraceae bacterium]|nr:pyridoxal phosphate-dependent class II aminotransferase [Desulfobacteraceae bacterium]
MIHGHGGNIYAAAAALGCKPDEITDMSSNINPLGPMPGLLEDLGQHIGSVCMLPEVDAARAVQAYARWQKIPENRVIAGAGTTEILYQLPRALEIDSALVVGPTYGDYADALEINRVACRYFMREPQNDFQPDMDALRKAAQGADAVFFCNPNNPTGGYTDTRALASLARSLPETYLIVDESYLPFVLDRGNESMAKTDLPNTVVLHSLSKMFCIPGLRVGFCAAPGDLAEKIAAYCPPWRVNALAQRAVIRIAQEPEKARAHAEKTRQYLCEQRAQMYDRLSDAPGLTVFPSDATFVLMKAAFFTAAEIASHLLDHRLLIRDCSNFKGLSKHFFRISLKDARTNENAARLIAQFAENRYQGGVLK